MKLNRLSLAIGAFSIFLGGVLLWLWSFGHPQGRAADRSDIPQESISALLEQVYVAFALDAEEEIYDALAEAVVGDLLDDLYLQRRAAQVADHAEDGEAAVIGVELFEVERLEKAQQYLVRWRVIGRITHTTHTHERINLYAADLTLTKIEEQWKIANFVLQENQRADQPLFVGGE